MRRTDLEIHSDEVYSLLVDELEAIKKENDYCEDNYYATEYFIEVSILAVELLLNNLKESKEKGKLSL